MAYDKKTRTITTTEGGTKELERDLVEFMNDVSQELFAEKNGSELKPRATSRERAQDAEKSHSINTEKINSQEIKVKTTNPSSQEALMPKVRMKNIAIFLNVVLLLVVIFLLAKSGAPASKEDFFIFFVVTAAPMASLYSLVCVNDESWLGLYFKRKMLEEKKKIKELSS